MHENLKSLLYSYFLSYFCIMDLMDCRDYILSLPAVEESQPFDDEVVVYKIGGKWFAVVIFSRGGYLAVKCNPDRAIILRDRYSAIAPAWHFNKRHWNDLLVAELSDEMVKREIRHSYFCVIKFFNYSVIQILSLQTTH